MRNNYKDFWYRIKRTGQLLCLWRQIFHTEPLRPMVVYFFLLSFHSLIAQCDTEVSGVFTYCNALGTPGSSGYFVAFRVKDLTGDTLNVVDLNGNNIANRGKRINDINTQQEPPGTSLVPVQITGIGADTVEFWYFGPYANGSEFNIVLVDPSDVCDTIFVASGIYDCMDNTGTSDPGACSDNSVPLYFLDFSQSEFNYGGGEGGNENFDAIFLIMQRERESSCCDIVPNSQKCFEFIIRLGEDDIGLSIDDVGSGSTAGELYADTLNMFACTGNSSQTWPFTQSGGQSSDMPLCIGSEEAREYVVLSCKPGGNVTGVSMDALSSISAPPRVTTEDCAVTMKVYNVISAFWSSPDDPGLDNFLNCDPDSLACTFLYDPSTFGEVSSCDGDTFIYIVGGYPDNACLNQSELIYDTTYVIVYPSLSVSIDSVCFPENDSLTLTATVNSSGCPYTLLWSTGDTTLSINVPNISSQYIISVTRPYLDSVLTICNDRTDDITIEPEYFRCDLTDLSAQCISNPPPADLSLIYASGCGVTPVYYYAEENNGGLGCATDPLIILRYYIVDYDGDTLSGLNDKDTCIQIITFSDNTPPVLTCPANVTIGCFSSTLPGDTNGPATAVDNCDTNPAINYTDLISNGNCPQSKTIQRTWRAIDACGNSSQCVQQIVIRDLQAPVIICPPDTLVNCLTATSPLELGSAFATDNCDLTVTPVYTDIISPGSCPQEFIIQRHWSSSDTCHTSVCFQSIIVRDTIAPVINCAPDVTIACAIGTLPSQTGMTTASDNCDPSITPSYSDVVAPGNCFITRTWTAIDDCGNSSSCEQTITVNDTVPPSLECPADITIQFGVSTLPSYTGFATAFDSCEGMMTLLYIDSLPSGNCPEVNFIIRTWTVIDHCGNATSCQQSILILDHGSICGNVSDDQGLGLDSVEIQLIFDANTNGSFDGGDTVISSIFSDEGTGNFCFMDLKPCHYILLEFQPDGYTSLYDFDINPDPDGNDSLDGPDNQIPVVLAPGENDEGNQFLEGQCPVGIAGAPNDTICDGGNVIVQIDDVGGGLLSYNWNFGSGATPATGVGVGPHMIQYSVTSQNQLEGAIIMLTISKSGCPDLTAQYKEVIINPFPDPAIDASTAPLCYYSDRVFQPGAPIISGATYLWSFGEGAVPDSATGYGPHEVYYTTTGTKMVELSIFPNAPGSQCPDSSSISFVVNPCTGNITGSVIANTGAPIPGVLLRLYTDNDTNGVADNNSIIKSTTTAANGEFSMVNLTPGNYVLVQIQPAGWTTIDDSDHSPDDDIVINQDSLDNIIPVTLLPSEIDEDNIFKETANPGSISGNVFADANGNEFPDLGEGLADVEIQLHPDINKDGIADGPGPIVVTMTTGTGSFSFVNIPVGNYVLTEVSPDGYVSVRDYDFSNDLDTVINTNQMNDTIPLTVKNGEHDANNYFIDEIACILVVSNINDSGTGSLRNAFACANDGDMIVFHPDLAGQTILINSTTLEITHDISIVDTLNQNVTIKSEITGLFDIASDVTFLLSKLNIIGGIGPYPGSAFYNFGHLILEDVIVQRNPENSSEQYLINNMEGSQVEIRGATILSQ